MIVIGDHDVTIVPWIQMGKKEFSGIRIHDRSTNDFTVKLGRCHDIFPEQGLIHKALFIDKAFNAVQREGNNLDHRLEDILTASGPHNRFTGIEVQQQIDTLKAWIAAGAHED